MKTLLAVFDGYIYSLLEFFFSTNHQRKKKETGEITIHIFGIYIYIFDFIVIIIFFLLLLLVSFLFIKVILLLIVVVVILSLVFIITHIKSTEISMIVCIYTYRFIIRHSIWSFRCTTVAYISVCLPVYLRHGIDGSSTPR
jgi:hypothetical protein